MDKKISEQLDTIADALLSNKEYLGCTVDDFENALLIFLAVSMDRIWTENELTEKGRTSTLICSFSKELRALVGKHIQEPNFK